MDPAVKDYQLFLSGDPEGLSAIIRDYKDGLILYLNGIVQNVAVAEDLTEDVFVKLIVKRPKFSADSSFKTWLYTIGRNMAISYLRRNKQFHIPLENCPELTNEEMNLERQYIQKEEQRICSSTPNKYVFNLRHDEFTQSNGCKPI